MSKQQTSSSYVHEPTTVPQSSYQKYQDEVRPEQIQQPSSAYDHSHQPQQQQKYKPQQHESLTNPPPQPSSNPIYYQQKGEHPQQQQQQFSRRSKFGQENIQTNISNESVREINELINQVIESDYACHSIAYYFDRADIGLYGVADFFRNCGLVKCRKARMLMDYLMVRGAQVVLDDIAKPEKTEWQTPVQALEYLLGVQQRIYERTMDIFETAEKTNDAHLTDFLEEFVLRPLTLWMRRLSVLVSNAQRAGPMLGVYQLNKHLCYNMRIFFETNKEITGFLDS